jgi:hypothetical protein
MMTDDWWTRKDLGRKRSLADRGTIPSFASMDWRKSREIFSQDRVLVETGTKLLPNASLRYGTPALSFLSCHLNRKQRLISMDTLLVNVLYKYSVQTRSFVRVFCETEISIIAAALPLFTLEALDRVSRCESPTVHIAPLQQSVPRRFDYFGRLKSATSDPAWLSL